MSASVIHDPEVVAWCVGEHVFRCLPENPEAVPMTGEQVRAFLEERRREEGA